jgi:hypothetical protein
MLAGFPKSPIKNLFGMFENGQQGLLTCVSRYEQPVRDDGSVELSLQAANTLGCQDAHAWQTWTTVAVGRPIIRLVESAADSSVSNSRTFPPLFLLLFLSPPFNPHSSTPYPATLVTLSFLARSALVCFWVFQAKRRESSIYTVYTLA